MHKSKLAGFIIDCQTDDLPTAARFWSRALGFEEHHYDDPQLQQYVALVDAVDDLQVEVQRVDHPSRVHLDIETDNVEAEVARLEALGAVALERVRTWCVMQAPTGQKFCVIRSASRDFDSKANTWT